MRSHRQPVGEPVNGECHVTASPVMEAGLAPALRPINQVIVDCRPETGAGKHLNQIQTPGLSTRLELLRKILRPTPDVWLPMTGMNLFAKLEYVNPVGSIKDRWTCDRKAADAAGRGNGRRRALGR